MPYSCVAQLILEDLGKKIQKRIRIYPIFTDNRLSNYQPRPLTDEEFEQRLKLGCFAMHWESHGFRYGIGIEIDQWLSSGASVVVSGSRAYLDTARKKYPELRAILITAAPDVLEQRLVNRGRETPSQVKERLDRTHGLGLAPDENLTVIINDGPLEEAGSKLLQALEVEES